MNTSQAGTVGSGPSPISQQLARLDELVNKLSSVVVRLVEKIDPALLPVPPAKDPGGSGSSVAGSPVTVRLNIVSDHIETIISLIGEVTQRVEL